MPQILPLTDDFAVTAQPAAADFKTFKAAGYQTVICNRPDGEEPGQLCCADAKAAAEAAGLAYIAIPYQGRPSPAQVDAMAEALRAATGPVLAHCKSGTRSTYGWALAMAQSGEMSVENIIRTAATAGKDVSGLFA